LVSKGNIKAADDSELQGHWAHRKVDLDNLGQNMAVAAFACSLNQTTELTIEDLVQNDKDAFVDTQNVLCEICTKISLKSDIVQNRDQKLSAEAKRKLEHPTPEVAVPNDFCLSDRWEPPPVAGQVVVLEYFPHQPDRIALQASASHGCHLCSLLHHSTLAAEKRSEPWDVEDESLSGAGVILQIRCELRTRIDSGRCGCGHVNGPPRKHTIEQNHTMRIGERKGYKEITWSIPLECKRSGSGGRMWWMDRSLWTGSDSCIRITKKWMNTCNEKHTLCREICSSAKLNPTRLIDLESFPSRVQIIQTADLKLPSGHRPRYAALSHRWGTHMPLRLLEANRQDLESSVPLSELPRTYSDAAKTAAELGIRYLWIDSLCIIQDSATDWTAESSRMGDIYLGAVLTIAAHASFDATGGLFVTRNPLTHTNCYIKCPEKFFEVKGFDVSSTRNDRAALNDRGWVVQERILSPRTIAYGYPVVVWECVQCIMSECLSSSQYKRLKNDFHDMHLSADDTQNIVDPSPGLVEFHKSWVDILEYYTSAKLTVPSDKLVAINGLIKRLAKKTCMESTAGLWRDILAVELLWHVSPNATTSPRPSAWRAPSWSWAAIDGKVSNSWAGFIKSLRPTLTYQFEWTVEILESHQKVAENGQTVEAWLKVRLPTVDSTWGVSAGHELEGFGHRHYGTEDVIQDRWIPDSTAVAVGDRLTLALIARGASTKTKPGPARAVSAHIDIGLALRRVLGGSNKFERVGYFEQRFWSSSKEHLFVGETLQYEEMILV